MNLFLAACRWHLDEHRPSIKDGRKKRNSREGEKHCLYPS